ncbi:MAG: hypothetical protein K2K17_11850, partial [Lachnospiraceae bacterium]|nr:hypothetical protein [Lachnospiraceae bacterium]
LMRDLIAQFKDGEFVSGVNTSSSKTKEKNNSGMDSDAFLTLLVAEMQNQDPLEPTSNTEWVSQYATFTEVAEIQAIGEKMGTVQAQGLVGKQVIMKVENSVGETEYIQGRVDYVEYQGDKAFLSIGGNKYPIDKLDTIADDEYLEAMEMLTNITDGLKKLPDIDDITLEHQDTITGLARIINGMSDYQFSFVPEETFNLIEKYAAKLQELIAQKNSTEAGENDKNDTNDAGDADNADDANKRVDTE